MFKIVMFYQDPVVLTFAIVAIASLTRKFVRLDSVSNVQYTDPVLQTQSNHRSLQEF